MCTAAYFIEINDVIDELAQHQKSPPPSEITVMVHVQIYLSARRFSSKRTQAVIFSWTVNVYNRIPWPHCVTRSNLGSSSSLSPSEVYYYSQSYMRDLFKLLPLHCACLKEAQRNNQYQGLQQPQSQTLVRLLLAV